MSAAEELKFERNSLIPIDPRTKIFLTVTVSTITMAGGTGGMMDIIRPCLVALPVLLLLLSQRWKAAARFSITYAVLYGLELTVIPILTGMWNFILNAASGIYTHMLPGFVMGYYLISTTTVSEFVAAMERMHVPQKIVIPVSVVFRFFPTVREEYAAIRDAMKMRGITNAPQSHEDAGVPHRSPHDVGRKNRRGIVGGRFDKRAGRSPEAHEYL